MNKKISQKKKKQSRKKTDSLFSSRSNDHRSGSHHNDWPGSHHNNWPRSDHSDARSTELTRNSAAAAAASFVQSGLVSAGQGGKHGQNEHDKVEELHFEFECSVCAVTEKLIV
jgi:hypothetical protein